MCIMKGRKFDYIKIYLEKTNTWFRRTPDSENLCGLITPPFFLLFFLHPIINRKIFLILFIKVFFFLNLNCQVITLYPHSGIYYFAHPLEVTFTNGRTALAKTVSASHGCYSEHVSQTGLSKKKKTAHAICL